MAEKTEGLQDHPQVLSPQTQSPVPVPAAASYQQSFHPQGHHGKPYNKHNAQSHGGNAAHPGASGYSANSGYASHNGQRQNFLGNQKHYNNSKRNSYNQKINNHNAQFSGYPYPANVYPNGAYYFPYPYPQGMVPGIPSYNPQLPQQMQMALQQYPGMTSPGGSKIKITDKDGNEVDLDTNASAASLASTTPVPVHAQMVSGGGFAAAEPGSSPVASTASPSATPASAPAASVASKNNAAEEFRRKIVEKAKLAQKKKEEEKAAAAAKAAAEAQQKVAASAPVVEAKPAETETAATPAEQPIKHEEKNEESQPVAPEEPVETKLPVQNVEPERTAQEPAEVAEPAKTEEPTVQESEPVKAAEAAVETAETAEIAEIAETAETAETTEPTTAEPTESAELAEPVEKAEEVVENATSGAEDTTITEEDVEVDEDDEDVDEDEESVFDLSLFFARLSTAKPIEDPFTFNYPYPSTGVDSRWKQGEKKYRYDPQFLLQFKDYIQYPIDDAWKEKLEGLGIVPSKRPTSGPQRMNSNKFGNQMQGRFNGSMSGRSGQFDGRQNSRTGSKRRGGSSAGGPRDKSSRNRNQSKRGKEEEPPKPAEDVKPLVPSANRWVPRSRMKTEEVRTAPDGTVLLDTVDIERKVKSALNKLTLEMFEPITEDLLTIAKQSRWEDDAKTIKQVISLTFAKACDEPYWSSVYAQFCAKMLKEIPDEIRDVNTLTKSGEPASGGDLARRLLLATCQVEYEKGWVDKLPTNSDGSPLEPEMMSDEYYAMAAAKRRGLGLVKFIGNLYILNMLNDQVILHCLRDQSKNVIDPSEDSLENLSQLIKTVGPRFEASERNRAALIMIFDNIQHILEKCKLSSRIKFLLMDLQDLKKSNWKASKQDAGPKTIKEIHNEAELKRIEDSRALAEKRRSNKSGYNSGNYGGGDSRSNSSRGGSSWGNKKDSRAPAKDSRGFTAVPRSQSNRPSDTSMNASTMSPRENSKRTDSMASNIFAALDGEHDDGV